MQEDGEVAWRGLSSRLSPLVDHLSRATQQVDLALNSVDAALVDKSVAGRRATVGILQVDLDELVGESA